MKDNKPKCSECTAACCMEWWIGVGEKDIKRIADGLGISTYEVLKRYIWNRNGVPVLMSHGEDDAAYVMGFKQIDKETDKVTGACVFLNKDGRCGIYSFRPDVCRGFERGDEYCRDRYTGRDFDPKAAKAAGVDTKPHEKLYRIWTKVQKYHK